MAKEYSNHLLITYLYIYLYRSIISVTLLQGWPIDDVLQVGYCRIQMVGTAESSGEFHHVNRKTGFHPLS